METTTDKIKYDALVTLLLIRKDNSYVSRMFEDEVGNNYKLYINQIQSGIFAKEDFLKLIFNSVIMESYKLGEKYKALADAFDESMLNEVEVVEESETPNKKPSGRMTRAKLNSLIEESGEENDWHRAMSNTLDLKNFYKRLQTKLNKKELTDSQLRRISNASKMFMSSVGKILDEEN